MPNQFGPTFVYDTATVIGAPTLIGNSISPAQLVANTDDWTPAGLSGATVIRVSTDAARNLTGITGGQDGRMLILENVGAFSLGLIHDQTSAAPNRFYMNGAVAGGAIQLNANQSCVLLYDGTSSRWRVVSMFGATTTLPLAPTDNTGAAGTSPFLSHQDHTHPSPEYAASLTYTPTLTQSGAVTKTVDFANYYQIGKLVLAWVNLTVTGSGTSANAVVMGLPVTAINVASGRYWMGPGQIYDSSLDDYYPVFATWISTTAVQFRRVDVAAATPAYWGIDPAVGLAVSDTVSCSLMYEAA